MSSGIFFLPLFYVAGEDVDLIDSASFVESDLKSFCLDAESDLAECEIVVIVGHNELAVCVDAEALYESVCNLDGTEVLAARADLCKYTDLLVDGDRLS